jgi:hypothetical protein
LATWRLSSLIATEKGPLNIFDSIRKAVAMRGADGNRFFASLSDGVHCLWCVSVWIGALLALLVSNTLTEWIFYSLAASSGAIIIDSLIRKLDG